jgi:hypothetical protein
MLGRNASGKQSRQRRKRQLSRRSLEKISSELLNFEQNFEQCRRGGGVNAEREHELQKKAKEQGRPIPRRSRQ